MDAALPLAATGWIEDAIGDGGYPGLGGMTIAENLFPPIPSEVVLPLAGYLVSQGTMDFIPAWLVATLGSVIGAYILYALGRYGGRPVLYRYGRVLRVDEAKLDRADAWFDARGTWLVLFGRVVPGVRSIISIPAGASEMPVGRFLALTALGSAVWNAALIGLGNALGDRWGDVERYVGPAGKIAVGLLAVIASAWLVRRVVIRRWTK